MEQLGNQIILISRLLSPEIKSNLFFRLFTDKPIFHDLVYDGAADPTVIWNRKEKKWLMFYTSRGANAPGLDGVTWVHGTRIVIAESTD